jgi:hypothetical protein
MDNGESKTTPESIKELNSKMPENWAPENPKHNLSELGSNAMGNTGIFSNPEGEPLPQPDKAFDIKDVFPEEAKKADEKKPSNEEPKLIFDPSSITPKEEGLSQTAKNAVHDIRDLITRGDDPKDAYVNYQALRKAVSGGDADKGEKKA